MKYREQTSTTDLKTNKNQACVGKPRRVSVRVCALTLWGAVAEGAPRTSCRDTKWEVNISGLPIDHKHTESKHDITQSCTFTHKYVGRLAALTAAP